MAEPLKIIRNIGLVGLAITFLVCVGGLIVYQDDLRGAVHLNTAQSAMQGAVLHEVPGSALAIEDVTSRSAAFVLGVPSAEVTEEDARRLQDAVWIAYVEAFAAEGFAISHVCVTPLGADGAPGPDRTAIVDVVTLAARTGLQPPRLHAIYAANDLFDPALEAPPALDGSGE